ncbi:MAG: hypothetical protein Tsb0020_54240 [Haliangiales bacterium]
MAGLVAAWVGVALMAASAPAHAQQTGPQRIGIAVSAEVNVTPEDADQMAAALGEALETRLGVVATAGPEARRRMPLDGLPESCAGDAACRADLANRLNADELLFLVIVRVGAQVQLDVTWAEVGGDRLASRPAITIEDGDNLSSVFADAAGSLLPHIEAQVDRRAAEASVPPPQPRAQPQTPPSVTPSAGGGAAEAGGASSATWIAAGVAGAALIGGAGVGYLAMSGYSDCEPRGSCDDSELDSVGRNALIADALFVTAGIAAAVAVVLYLTSDDGGGAERAGGVSFQLGLDPGRGAGRPGRAWIGLGGRF